jgi:hypothetical protein
MVMMEPALTRAKIVAGALFSNSLVRSGFNTSPDKDWSEGLKNEETN